MKKALVCGAGGFIGHHLCRRLKSEGWWVRAVDIRRTGEWEVECDEWLTYDLRDDHLCRAALSNNPDEVYQLAADMGGMGFIDSHELDIVRNNVLINANMLHAVRNSRHNPGKYFFSSSACVYPDIEPGHGEVDEGFAYPAKPDNEYGWEKLYSERMVAAHARECGFEPRIARFSNTYGPEGTWRGGREKAPAALSRKVAEAPDGGSIEVWGDGFAVRAYTYIGDLIRGIRYLMQSDIATPVNIGSIERVTVNELAAECIRASGKSVDVQHIDGPVGVAARNFSTQKLRMATGWVPQTPFFQGIEKTYAWVAGRVAECAAKATESYDAA